MENESETAIEWMEQKRTRPQHKKLKPCITTATYAYFEWKTNNNNKTGSGQATQADRYIPKYPFVVVIVERNAIQPLLLLI